MANENDEIVEIEGQTAENATLLLAAAEELDKPADVVQTTGSGTFRVPRDVAEKAGLEPVKRESVEETIEREQQEAREREEAVATDLGSHSAQGTAKKAAAKKAPAKDKE